MFPPTFSCSFSCPHKAITNRYLFIYITCLLFHIYICFIFSFSFLKKMTATLPHLVRSSISPTCLLPSYTISTFSLYPPRVCLNYTTHSFFKISNSYYLQISINFSNQFYFISNSYYLQTSINFSNHFYFNFQLKREDSIPKNANVKKYSTKSILTFNLREKIVYQKMQT